LRTDWSQLLVKLCESYESMNRIFYRDIQEGICKSWGEFFKDLHRENSYCPYLKKKNYYDVFMQIVLSLIADQPIILLDSDFTPQEVLSLTGEKNPENQKVDFSNNSRALISKESFLSFLLSAHPLWSITIFTSGTTGLPQKVTHTFKSLTRFVKISERNSKAVWGFAYNPTHMAGLQVFFQALLNGNEIIRLFQLPREVIFEQISANKITHISSTPTFYRLLLPCQGKFESVVRLTSGGERFDPKTAETMTSIFPNAKITNVYASTEVGTLFASRGDVFEVKNELADKIKFVDDQLFIHKSLMGSGSSDDSEPWYASGDLVKIISQQPLQFKFLARKNEMINVGGYKVNPSEVEQVIREHENVKDARVSGKKNSLLGNIVIAEVVCKNPITEMELRSFLQEKLQEFKIPRMIKFVEQIDTTRTGKVKRV